MTVYDPVRNPVHYEGNGRISCKDAMASMLHAAEVTAEQAYWWGCAFKYLWRWPLKNGMQDVDKAIRCLEYLKETEKEEDDGDQGQAG